MEEEKIDPYYQNQAKGIIDMLFDAKLFHEKVSRDDMNAVEDLIAYYFKTFVDTANRMAELTTKWKNQQ